MAIQQRPSLHPGLSEPTIELVREGECYQVLEGGALKDECYRAEVLAAPEHCACDGNPMPANHPVFRDAERGYAISIEHCRVVAEVVAIDVDQLGHAYVEAVDHGYVGRRIAGIWYVREGQLIDNREGGSEPWTRDVAAKALLGTPEPAAEAEEAAAEADPIDLRCECGSLAGFRCLECGACLCSYGECLGEHADSHLSQEAQASIREAGDRGAATWRLRFLVKAATAIAAGAWLGSQLVAHDSLTGLELVVAAGIFGVGLLVSLVLAPPAAALALRSCFGRLLLVGRPCAVELAEEGGS